jgi:hypothetical protein
LRKYAEHDLMPLVDQHGPDALLAAISQLAHENHADVTRL